MGTEGLSGRAVFGGRGGSSAPLRGIATLTVSLAILPLAAGCSGSSLPSFGSSNPQSQAASVPPPLNASVAPAGQQAYAPPPSQPRPATAAPPAQQDYSDLMPYPKQSLAEVFRELGAAARSDRAASAGHIYAIRSTLYATSAGRGRYRRCSGAAGKFRYFEPAGLSQAIAVRSHVEQISEPHGPHAPQDFFQRDLTWPDRTYLVALTTASGIIGALEGAGGGRSYRVNRRLSRPNLPLVLLSETGFRECRGQLPIELMNMAAQSGARAHGDHIARCAARHRHLHHLNRAAEPSASSAVV